MSTMGPLCPEQLTQEETLEEVCVGPTADQGCGATNTERVFTLGIMDYTRGTAAAHWVAAGPTV